MPRINRIRVTNINYDNDKKQLPDLLFQLRGQDGIILLANGGGKTLLIQLAIQTVLPNESMNRRRISDLLTSRRFTGHVAVEWILDSEGEGTHYLCTGFTFTRGYDDQGLRYFNYLLDYGEKAQLTIESLPLIKPAHLQKREEPMGFQELKDWLREQPAVLVFEKKSLYQERLRIYRILPEEWRRIRDTNGTEGGVDKFFERCHTTWQLLENLLIPGVEEILFQTEQKRRELLEAFAEHRAMLLKIPLIKANLKDFQIIRKDSESVVSQVQELDTKKKAYQRLLEKIAVLDRTLTQEIEEADQELRDYDKKKQLLEEQKRTLLWKKESHRVFLQELALKKAQRDTEEKQRILEGKKEKEKEAQERTREITALYYYYLAQEANGRLEKCRDRLNLLHEEEPELKKHLHSARGECLPLWEEEKKSLEREQEKAQQKRDSLKEKLEVLREEMREAEEEKGERIEEKTVLAYWFQEYLALKKKLAKEKIPLTQLANPQRGYQEQELALEALREQIETQQQMLEDLERERDELEEKKAEQRERRVGLEKDIKEIENRQETYQKKKDEVEGELTQLHHFTRDIFLQKEEILKELFQRVEEIREQRVVYQKDLGSLEEQWILMERKNYYIPHRTLLTIQEQLEKNGIYSVLGSEWLAAQGRKEEEKIAYIHNNPLLPYCILLEESQQKAAERILTRMEDLTPDIPLPFLIKRDLNQKEGDRKERMLLVGKSRIHRPDSWQIFSSSSYLEDFKDQLVEMMEEKRKEVYRIRREEEEKNRLKKKVELFFDEYTKQQVLDWQEQKKQLLQQFQEIQEGLKGIEEEKRDRKKQLQEGIEKRKALQEEVQKKERRQEQLADFCQRHRQYPEKKEQKEQVSSAIIEWREKGAQLEEEKERALKERTQLLSTIKDQNTGLEQHQRVFYSLGLDQAPPLPGKNNYRKARSRVEAILHNLSQGRQDLSQLEELLAQYQREYQKHRGEYQELGLAEGWLKEQVRPVSRDEVKEEERSCKEQRMACEKATETVYEARSQVETIDALKDSLSQDIQMRFNRPPYLEFSPIHHEEEYRDIIQKLQKSVAGEKALQEKIQEKESWKEENQEAKKRIQYSLKEEEIQALPDRVKPLQTGPPKPQEAVKILQKQKDRALQEKEEQKKRVLTEFQDYSSRLEKTANAQVRQFKGHLQLLMKDERLFQYPFVYKQFSRIMEALDHYQNHYRETLQESQRNMEILTDRCLRKAQIIYESITEIPKSSRIPLYGRNIQVFQLDWPVLSQEEGREKIHGYLEKVLSDLQQWKEQGEADDELDRRMQEMIRSRNLIEVIAPIKHCRVRVYKPRKESMLNHNRLEYSPWEEVQRWSGGEEYSIYVAMFMIIISHIREQLEGRPNIWKVIMADNPFGRASSPHILEVVFKIARSNHIQFLCFTAHKQEEIVSRFPVVYSLRLRSAYGREVMQAQEMETGYYQKPLEKEETI